MDKDQTSNAGQIEFWNGGMGEHWVRARDQFDNMLAPLAEAALKRGEFAPGQSVIDVGCGCGGSSAAIAALVAPGGSVTGIDISEVMLAEARLRKVPDGSSLTFNASDASTHDFSGFEADRIFSRFGIMFFDDNPAAFANLRTALKPGGRLTFICWRDADENPWLQVPSAISAKYAPPQEPMPPGAPGPFALADADALKSLLSGAGFDQIEIERLDRDILVGGGGTIAEATSFYLAQSLSAGWLADLSPKIYEAVEKELLEAFVPYAGPDGVSMGSSTWIVTAHRAS